MGRVKKGGKGISYPRIGLLWEVEVGQDAPPTVFGA